MTDLIRDRYEVQAVVARGGQGEVLRALDHQHDRTVVLKARWIRADADRDALLSEARMLLVLAPHPGLPLVRDDFFDGDRYYLVMDWVDGMDLERVLGERGDPGLSFVTVVRYLEQVASALDHLHGHRPPIVHGDVKPANLVLTPEGRVVLVDFGIASRPGDATSAGGTPGYQAPEAARGDRTPAVDVFGLAATAFTLLSGVGPGAAVPSWEGLPAADVRAVQRALRRALSIDPARRPPSAGDLVARLRSRLQPSLPTGTVTFLLAAIDPSSVREGDRTALREAAARLDDILGEHADRHRGTVVGSDDDGRNPIAVFARATDAATCALQVQRRLRVEPRPGVRVGVRIGLHTGEAELRDGGYVGGAVNRAGRIRDLGVGGQVLLSRATADLVEDALPREARLVDLGERVLPDLARPERVYQLTHPGMPHRPAPRRVSGSAGAGLRVPLPPVLAVAGTTLVGRQAELRALIEAWEAARLGAFRGVLVGGAGGVGKTRLVAELARTVHASGGVVLGGRSQENGVVPYQPFVEAMRWLTSSIGRDRVVRLVPDAGPQLSRLVPELHSGGPPPPTDPEADRYRLFDAVRALLDAVARRSPAMLVLDDVHWADRATLLLLRHLAGSPDAPPLLIVTTHRPTDLSVAAADAVAELEREPHTVRVQVAGLSEDDVRTLVAARTGREPPPEFVRLLHEQTAGNPFFVQELVRHLEETDAIDAEAARWGSRHLAVPRGVADVVEQRLSRLSERCNQLLSLAAVAGSDFDLGLVEHVAGVDEDDLLAAIDEAVGAGILAEERPERYAFAQPLIRETMYGRLGDARRRRLHRRFADAIERDHAHDLGPYLAELAHHLLEAVPAVDLRRAIDFARRAADRATAQLAYEEAAASYERALAVLELLDPAPALRCQLLVGLGDVRWRAGDDTGATEAFGEALDIAREAGETTWEAEALLQLGSVESLVSRVEGARELLTPAIELFERAGDVHGVARATEMLSLTWRTTDLDRQHSLLERAARLFAEAGDTVRELLAYQDLAYTTSLRAADEFDRWYARSVALTADAPDPHAVASLRRTEAYRRYYLGDLLGVERPMSEAETLAARAGDVFTECDVRWLRSHLAIARGSLEEAVVIGDGLVRTGRARGFPRTEEMGRVVLARAALRRGRPGEAERHLVVAQDRILASGVDRELSDVHRAWAFFELERGIWDAAIEAAELLRKSAERYGDALDVPWAALLAARAHLGAGRYAHAAAMFAEALDLSAAVEQVEVPLLAAPLAAETAVLAGRKLPEMPEPPDDGFPEHAAVALEALAIAAARAGNLRSARAHLADAVAAWDRLGLTVWLARALAAQAALGEAAAAARSAAVLRALDSPLDAGSLSPLS